MKDAEKQTPYSMPYKEYIEKNTTFEGEFLYSQASIPQALCGIWATLIKIEKAIKGDK